MPEQEEHHYRLAIAGTNWPSALNALGSPLATLKAARKTLERSSEAELWIGYGSPISLLTSLAAADPHDALERWAKQARRALELRQAHHGRCHLINLSLLDAQAIAALLDPSDDSSNIEEEHPADRQQKQAPQPPSDPDPAASLDVRLVLALQHRQDLADLYADLEGCCTLLGREPQFHLPITPLRGAALADRCLESWRQDQIHQQQWLERQAEHDSALKEAREETELTLLQLHQVQEELEQVFLENRKLSEERDALEQRLQQAEQSQQQRDALQAEHDAALKEAHEEAELTLLQLHQVQEELEHYFLEHRKAREELEALQQEALHLFLHATPTTSLDHSQLERLTRLAREALQLN